MHRRVSTPQIQRTGWHSRHLLISTLPDADPEGLWRSRLPPPTQRYNV